MSVVTSNPFSSLGNDSDGEEKPVVPVKTVDKNNTRTTKRNVEPSAPVRTGGSGGNRHGPGGNEGAFRDRGAGSDRNHDRSTEEVPYSGPRGGANARIRGGRGARHPRDRDDRHPSRAGNYGGSDKQVAQSWGANDGPAEFKDEQAGDAMAYVEKREGFDENAAEENAEEETEKQVSYDDYLAQQAQKKAALDNSLKVRVANEGSKLDKKWANAKPLANEEEEFISATGGKAKRERERKVKQTIDFDPRFVEPERTRGGRGGYGGRGGHGGRGGRGGDRRGDRAGDRGRDYGYGGSFRGGHNDRENDATINTYDQAAFPSLGGN